jgi:hypothetical protein
MKLLTATCAIVALSTGCPSQRQPEKTRRDDPSASAENGAKDIAMSKALLYLLIARGSSADEQTDDLIVKLLEIKCRPFTLPAGVTVNASEIERFFR